MIYAKIVIALQKESKLYNMLNIKNMMFIQKDLWEFVPCIESILIQILIVFIIVTIYVKELAKNDWIYLPGRIQSTSEGKDFYYDYNKPVHVKEGKVKYKKLILKVINYHINE